MSLANMTQAEIRALGGLALSCAGADESAIGMRALAWYNSLLSLGINVPLHVVLDLGAALLGERPEFAAPRELPRLPEGVNPGEAAALLRDYGALLTEVAGTDIAAKLKKTRIDDGVLSTLLTRALGPVVDRWRGNNL